VAEHHPFITRSTLLYCLYTIFESIVLVCWMLQIVQIVQTLGV